jgi:hypothetical protein
MPVDSWQEQIVDAFFRMMLPLDANGRAKVDQRLRAWLDVEIDPDAGPIQGNRA